ncbi:MAG: 1-acyl-sn-glycerol-3-phosphate acyltransferase [Maribacter sp.]
MHTIAKFIYFKILGWKLHNEFPIHIKKCVVPVVPHTSWHDFYIGILVRNVWNAEINFVGKKSLFKWPFGAYFRWMGGTPIDRTKSTDFVTATAKIFEEKEVFRLNLAPEGTRKKVQKLKTGFYYIAKAAKVPIVMVAFDFENKQVKVAEPFFVSNNIEEDFKIIDSFYKGVKGKVPENSYY